MQGNKGPMSEPIGRVTKRSSTLSGQHHSENLRICPIGVPVSAKNWLSGGVDGGGVGVGVSSEHGVVLGAEHVEQSTIRTQRA